MSDETEEPRAKSNVHKIYPSNAADFPDLVLEQALGVYSEVLVLGWDKDEMLDVRRTNALSDADMLLMIEIFKQILIQNHIGYTE